MRDRVPLYPGRVKLVPVSGQENVYDMTRADQPTQQGDPLNKATLLKDATAALFGLGTDAVPDDVFSVISYMSWREYARFDTAGAFEWTSDFDGVLGIFLVGGGGSGAGGLGMSSSSSDANRFSGGASGYVVNTHLPINIGDKLNIVVGAGGVKLDSGSGVDGGTTSVTFGDRSITASGGKGGVTNKNRPLEDYFYIPGGVPAFWEGDGYYGTEMVITDYQKFATWKNINMFEGREVCGSGGTASMSPGKNGYGVAYVGGKSPLTQKGGGDGIFSYSVQSGDTLAGNPGTEPGSGGGGTAARYSSGVKAIGGQGADGAVILYRRVSVTL